MRARQQRVFRLAGITLFAMFMTVTQVGQPVLAAPPVSRQAAAQARPAGPGQAADQIVVYKSKRILYLLRDNRVLRKYRIALGRNPVGHKLEWGDNRTPEGKYRIDLKNPESAYFLSMRVSYPDATDATVASALQTSPGDWIMIHGQPNDRRIRTGDWTNGCIAVTNAEMAEIWRLVPPGTPIAIWP